MRKITLKMRIKYANRKERQATNNCHRYSLPCGACAIKRKLHYKNSIFRLHADNIINRLNKLEEELNHE